MFHGLFHFSNCKNEVLLTGMHAPSNGMQRRSFWQEIKEDIPPASTPWLVIGDLNEVVSPSEKKGGRPFNASQALHLNQFIDKAGLIDLGFNGNPSGKEPKRSWKDWTGPWQMQNR